MFQHLPTDKGTRKTFLNISSNEGEQTAPPQPASTQ